ncbi:MAG TPA: GAF domain-containing protein, partial [Allocoleopsis sp.]
MLMPPSSEFVTLCRSQVALLTNSLGAAVSIVYLTEELMEASNAKLVPLVAYPETVTSWKEDRIFTLLAQGRGNPTTNQPLLISQAEPAQNDRPPVLPRRSEEFDTEVQPLQAAERALMRQQQVMMPLIHEEVVMGLLVTAREDRAWNEAEQTQIQQISETLALA